MALTESDIKIIIAAELKNKGFKDAEKASNALNTQFKKLGKTVLAVFGAREIVQFGKAAVAAFQEDEIAARRFEQALKGVNLGFATPALENYLEGLERQTAVTKNELRPAFQQLASTTRSVAMSQDILNTALDVSAGTGIDLNTVVSDLSRSFLGNNNSLSKYQLGLSRTELRAKSFNEIQQLLNEQFAGQRAAYLDTYAGKVSLLEASYERMQTTIGAGLVDAFQILSGEQGIGAGISAMEMFADKIADTTRGIAGLLASFTNFQSYATGLMQFVKALGKEKNVIDAIAAIGKQNKPLFFPGGGVGQPAVDKRLEAIEEAAIKRQKELEALRLKSLKAQEKANRLKRISIMLMEKEKKFDLTRIQLQAALQGKLTSEEANRVKELQLIEDLKQAIAEQDLDKAEKLLEELNKVREETEILAETLLNLKAGNPFEDWDDYFKNVEDRLAKLQTQLMGLLAGMKVDLAAKNQAVIEAKTDRSTAVAAIVEASGVSAQLATEDALKAIEEANKAIAAATTAEELKAAETFLEAALESKEAADTLTESVAAVTLASALTDLDLANEYLSQSIDAATSVGLIPEVTVNVNIEGNVTTQEDLVNSITEGLYQAQKSGKGLLFSAVAI